MSIHILDADGGSTADLPISALLSRLADTLDGLAGRTAQMQDDLGALLTQAGQLTRAQLRELQGLDLIHQTLDDLRAAAHLAADAAGRNDHIDIAVLADLLRLESCRIALLQGGEAALQQEQPSGEIDFF
ncbi:hypothetical protein [Vannielia litorea]|uniref:Uncharacterized protein n=1 Tax=Vannielia litorea TaxID=1217970 RepID=A0A1N6F2N7_9RHOB|nr:hypothetical protein [Vannielia litorea]SIN89550.1 hypothetical protein SAMN05444002_1320 [Vannielia litorea]